MSKPDRAQQEYDVLIDQVTRRHAEFWARIKRNLRIEGECRIWTGAVGSNGYPKMNIRLTKPRRTFQIQMHRAFLVMMTNAPIPKDKEAGHYQCFNRACVRHVKLQTRQENLRDRDALPLIIQQRQHDSPLAVVGEFHA